MAVSLEKLKKLESLRGLREKTKLQELQLAELALRDAIRTIEGQQKDSLQDHNELLPMRTIGADAAWYRWAEHEKEQLKQQIVQIRLQMEAVAQVVAVQSGRERTLDDLAKRQPRAPAYDEGLLNMSAVLSGGAKSDI